MTGHETGANSFFLLDAFFASIKSILLASLERYSPRFVFLLLRRTTSDEVLSPLVDKTLPPFTPVAVAPSHNQTSTA